MANEEDARKDLHGRYETSLFVIVFGVLFILDFLSKNALAGARPGTVISTAFDPVFKIHVSFNTGGAWGVFPNSAVILGILAVVICVVVLVFFAVQRKSLSTLETVGLALIFAGGIGNALDRLISGAVLDFIDLSFMNFPIFNVADIGVTCGVVIFFLGIILRLKSERKGA
ncbi:MAG: signal peptidase II [Eggerthellaceae bacterium]